MKTPPPVPHCVGPAAVDTIYHIIEYCATPALEGKGMYQKRFVQEAGCTPDLAIEILKCRRKDHPTKTLKLVRVTAISDVLDF